MPPRLLLVDPDAAFRLRVIQTLQVRFELLVPAEGDDVLRLARAGRPEVGLFAGGGRQRPEALRLARVLKTDVRAVPGLGIYTRGAEPPLPEAALDAVGADGFIPNATAEGLLAFAEALLRGERPRPNPWPAPERGLGRRVLNRLFG